MLLDNLFKETEHDLINKDNKNIQRLTFDVSKEGNYHIISNDNSI